jgi:hypothetical protein
MDAQVKLFESNDQQGLELKINQFIDTDVHQIFDIKYSTDNYGNSHNALILYKPIR